MSKYNCRVGRQYVLVDGHIYPLTHDTPRPVRIETNCETRPWWLRVPGGLDTNNRS